MPKRVHICADLVSPLKLAASAMMQACTLPNWDSQSQNQVCFTFRQITLDRTQLKLATHGFKYFQISGSDTPQGRNSCHKAHPCSSFVVGNMHSRAHPRSSHSSCKSRIWFSHRSHPGFGTLSVASLASNQWHAMACSSIKFTDVSSGLTHSYSSLEHDC